MTAFRVGQRVVCVDDGWTKTAWYKGQIVPNTLNRLPMINEILTVGEIRLGGRHGDTAFLGFREIERGYWFHECFRPVVSRPTSIAIFQEMLSGKRVGERV